MTELPLSFLLQSAEKYPETICLRTPEERYTYAQFLDRTRRRATFLAEKGVGKGTLVTIQTRDYIEFISTMFACWMRGAILAPLNTGQPPRIHQVIDGILKPGIGFHDKENPFGYEPAYPVHLLELSETPLQVFTPVEPDDISMIMFTSGTSGVPKGVPWKHCNTWRNAVETGQRIGVEQADNLFLNTPPYTTSSINHILTMFAVGATLSIDQGFMFGAGILDQLDTYECTAFGGAPVHFMRLIGALKVKKPLRPIRFLFNSGEHLPTPVLEELIEYLPETEIHCVYGLTEVSGRFCILPWKDVKKKAGSVGFPLPSLQVTVRDDDGKACPVGEVGEVYITGSLLMDGYYNAPEANAKAFSEHGFATGDVGSLDEDGYLFLVGRNDSVFKVGGEKVSIGAIEELLLEFDMFDEVAVIAEFDQNMGNVPVLYYVLHESCSLSRRDIVVAIRERLPKTHIPVRFYQASKLPRTQSGKVMRQAEKLKPYVIQ